LFVTSHLAVFKGPTSNQRERKGKEEKVKRRGGGERDVAHPKFLVLS